MIEFLNTIYRDYLNNYTAETSETVRNINKYSFHLDDLILNSGLQISDELEEEIYDTISDMLEASFIAGVSQCARLMSNGKIDFFPNDERVKI